MKNQVAVEIGGRRYVLREAKRSPFPDCRSCAVRRFCDHDGEHFGHPLCLAVPHPADRFVRFVREKSPIRAALERAVLANPPLDPERKEAANE